MHKRIPELLNRKPHKWGKVSVKAFEQEITILQEALRNEMKKSESYEQVLEFYADDDSYIQHFEQHPSNIEVDKGKMAKEVLAENGFQVEQPTEGEIR